MFLKCVLCCQLNQERRGLTPLIYACHKGQLKVVNLLLDCGADVNGVSREGRSALSVALERSVRSKRQKQQKVTDLVMHFVRRFEMTLLHVGGSCFSHYFVRRRVVKNKFHEPSEQGNRKIGNLNTTILWLMYSSLKQSVVLSMLIYRRVHPSFSRSQ